MFSQLAEKTEQHAQANRAKDRLFAIIGHDLRSPIANFRMALDLARSGHMSPEELRQVQQDLHMTTDQTLWTLGNLMEWGVLQLNELACLPVTLAVHPAAEEAAALLRIHAETKRIRIRIDVPDEAVVRADEHQLASILRNLLSNAVKFTQEGGTVRVSAARHGDMWKISVQDTGVGMTAGQMANLFEEGAGFSSSVGTASERGVGLGLRITASFVQTNGGTITVASVVGKGTVFHFTLPASQQTGAMEREEDHAGSGNRQARHLCGENDT